METPTGTITPPAARPPYRPFQKSDEVTFGDWFVTLLLSYIPIVNVIMLLIWAFGSSTNPSKANWAKATLVWMVIGIFFAILIFVVLSAAIFQSMESFE